jgi:hypothetical protein
MGIFDDDFANGHLPAKVLSHLPRVACQRVCNPMNAFFEPRRKLNFLKDATSCALDRYGEE